MVSGQCLRRTVLPSLHPKRFKMEPFVRRFSVTHPAGKLREKCGEFPASLGP
jgi:hypothetical protein